MRENIIQRLEDRIDSKVRRIRNKPSRALEDRVPRIPNRNLGGGVSAGLVQGAILLAIDEVIGVPFGADTEIVDIEPTKEGQIFTINVNSPTRNLAKARSFLQAGTGFTSILTDTLDVRDVEVTNTRILRDTYQVQVHIKD